MSFSEVIGAAGHIPLPPYITGKMSRMTVSGIRQFIRALKDAAALLRASLHQGFTGQTF
jgi:hypothetical protein